MSSGRVFDAIVLADSPYATTKLLGLTLMERGRRVAGKVGARRVFVIDGAAAVQQLPAWEAERGDAGLLVLQAGDQIVHPPLVQPLLDGSGERRLAVGPDGEFGGALYAEGLAARDAIARVLAAHVDADRDLAATWTGATRIVHGEIARHLATTPAERRSATKLLLRILVKSGEDSPISRYIYRPLSQPLTRLLLHTPVTANQVSYVVGLIGLFGCYLTTRPSQASLIWGAALVFISGIIDGCDGEISRLRLTSSSFGAWLDTVVDELTTFTYCVAIGYHTYQHHPEPWIAASIIVGGVCYLASIYGIYYFCVVVIQRGGSQYYVGDLVIVDDARGPALTPRPRAASKLPPWMLNIGAIMLYVVRRDFINLVALGLTFLDAYAVIYFTMALGNVVATFVVVPEHLKLRRQLRELRGRGGAPRFVSA